MQKMQKWLRVWAGGRGKGGSRNQGSYRPVEQVDEAGEEQRQVDRGVREKRDEEQQSDENEKRQSKLSILLSFAVQVYIPSLFVFGSNGMVIPVIPPYGRKAFHASDFSNGMVMSSLNAAGVVLDIPGSFLIAKIGADLSGFFSGSMILLSGFLGSIAPNIMVLSLSRFVHGLGWVTWLTSRTFIFSLSSSQADQATDKRATIVEKHRGLLLSGLGGMNRISNLLFPVLGSLVATTLGYRAVFVLVSIFGALVLPFAFSSYMRERRRTAEAHNIKTGSGKCLKSVDVEKSRELSSTSEHGSSALRLVWSLLKSNWRELLTVGSPCLVLNMLRQARDFLFAVAAMNSGFNQQEIGELITWMYVADFLSFPVSGYLMDKFGRKYALVSSLSVISMGCILLGLVGESKYKFVLFLVALVAGSGSGIGSGIAMCMGADLANVARFKFRVEGREELSNVPDKSVMTVFIGMFRASQDLGQMGGPQMVGMLSDSVSLSFSGTLCGFMGLLAALFTVFCVTETKDLVRSMSKSRSQSQLQMASM